MTKRDVLLSGIGNGVVDAILQISEQEFAALNFQKGQLFVGGFSDTGGVIKALH